MAGKVGMVVNYQPTAEEAVNFNNNNQQMAAVITAWDEESEKASLTVFVPGGSYVVPLHGIGEDTKDGSFQQPGSLSATATANKAAKEAQAKADAEQIKKQAEEAKKQQQEAKAAPAHASK